MKKIMLIFSFAIIALLIACGNTYTVEFQTDGSAVSSLSIKSGKKIGTEPITSKVGYDFLVWTLNGEEFDFETPIEKDIILVATWSIQKFDVTFNPDNNTASTVVKVDYNQTVSSINVSKDGYDFKHWAKDGVAFDFNTKITSNTTLVAIWEETVIVDVYYEVKFNSDGGGSFPTQSILEGELATKPVNEPIKANYKFMGWFLGDVEYKFDAPVTEDIELVAKYEKIHTVKFNTKTSQVIPDQKILNGQTIIQPTVNERIGYEFKGWLLNGSEFDITSSITADINLEANWEQLIYQVRFFFGDIQIGETQNVPYGDEADEPSNEEKNAFPGYYFTGWDSIEWWEVYEDLDIFGIYTKITYVVTFYVKGTSVSSQTIEWGEVASLPEEPSYPGEEFNGWYTDQTFSTPFDEEEAIYKTTYVYAKLDPIIYEIKYFDGSTQLTLPLNSYTIFDNVVLPKLDPKGAFVFLGWCDNAELEGNYITNIAMGSTGVKEFYADYFEGGIVYDIEYELNGGEFGWIWADGEMPKAPAGSSGANNLATYADTENNIDMIFSYDLYRYLKERNLLVSGDNWAYWVNCYNTPNYDPRMPWGPTQESAHCRNYHTSFYTSITNGGEPIGGFFGTEPYKTKYEYLFEICLIMHKERYPYTSALWSGPMSTYYMACIIDGYMYGNQSVKGTRTGGGMTYDFDHTIERNSKPMFGIIDIHVSATTTYLHSPVKEGYIFVGWYDNASFSGTPIFFLGLKEVPAVKYYAKYEAIS